MADLKSFFLFALIASVTPGPNNIILTTVGARFGVWRGIPALLGTCLGIGVMLFVVAISLATFISSSEVILSAIRIVGTGTLLWLAWTIATAPTKQTDKNTESSFQFGFIPAVLFQWINPKAWIVSVSIVGTYLALGSDVFQQAAMLSFVFIVAAFLGCLPWLVCGAAIRKHLQSDSLARGINIVLGVSLALSVLMLF